MKNVVILLLCLMLVAGQAFHMTASANPKLTLSDNLLALAQPIAVGIPKCPIAIEQQDGLTEKESQYVKGVKTYAHTFGNYEINCPANNGIIIGPESGNGFIDLRNGNILLSAELNMIISTHEGKIHIGSGTTAFVCEYGNNVVVYDLVQSKPNRMFVVVGQNRLTMEPGQMLVLTRENINNFEKLEVTCRTVAYRNARLLNFGNGAVNVFIANFSIPSALVIIQPLKLLVISKNKEDKLLLDKLLKSAALVGDLRLPKQTRNTVALSTKQN